MFGLFNRKPANRKPTLLETIVNDARSVLIKHINFHANEIATLEPIIRKHLDKLKFHKETVEGLRDKLRDLDGVATTIKPAFNMLENGEAERLPYFDELTADDFGLGEELAADDPAIFGEHTDADEFRIDPLTNDMGDGRAATETDTLAKIESANAERAITPPWAYVPPTAAPAMPIVEKPKRKPRKPSRAAILAS